MTREELVRRYWHAFNAREPAALDDVLAPDFANHAAAPGTPAGPAGQAAVFERLWAALPDGRFDIAHLAADGDWVVCVGTMSGTHSAELLGAAASGERVVWRMCHLFRFDAEDRVAEHDAIRDDRGLRRQMGVG